MSEEEKIPKLRKILSKKIGIRVITGLKIGGNKEEIEIGGIDNPVIKTIIYTGKNTEKNVPYIPGSSLKGRIRSLLEISGNDEKLIKKVFGDKSETTYTRVLFEDSYPTNDTLEMWKKLSTKYGIRNGIEAKYENKIDRETARAEHPRQNERVVPGSAFESTIRLLIFNGDEEEEMKELIDKGLHLLELTYLGGNGSRGYGRIRIEPEEWKEEWKYESIGD